MSEKQPAPPDWVNDVPARYGPDWPEERRCRHVFADFRYYDDDDVGGRLCGYPTEDGQEYCLFHREGVKDTDSLCTEIELAVAEGVFLADAKLSGADLSGTEGLWDAALPGADLSGAMLCFAALGGADLEDANLSGADLWDATLEDARLIRVTITPSTRLGAVHWWAKDERPFWRKWLQIGEPMIRDEREGGNDSLCPAIYRQIRRCYQESEYYDEAGRFFVREMECKRKQLPRGSLMRPVYHVLHFVSDYFENPWRVVVIGLLVVLLFGFLHAGIGFVWATGKGVPAGGQDIGGTAVTLNPFAADWVTMGRALYFSAITFTATGYGDYVPNPGGGQFLAALESLVGVFLMAMFLVCLARKFGRA